MTPQSQAIDLHPPPAIADVIYMLLSSCVVPSCMCVRVCVCGGGGVRVCVGVCACVFVGEGCVCGH